MHLVGSQNSEGSYLESGISLVDFEMASNKDPSRDYDAAKSALKAFLAQFHTVNPDTGRKDFVYARQITNIAHREQVEK